MASSTGFLQKWFSPVSHIYQIAYRTTSALLFASNSVPPERLFIQTFTIASSILSQSSSTPPDRLLLQALTTSLSFLTMATSKFMNFGNLSLEPKSKKTTSFLDLPVHLKRKILCYNGDEQMVWGWTNDVKERSQFSIGRDPIHKDQPAPQSVWNMALVCKQLFNELLPVLPLLDDDDDDDNNDNTSQNQIRQTLFQYAAVNVRFIPDIYEVAKFLEGKNMLPFLPILRLWLVCSMDATKFFMLGTMNLAANEFVDGMEENWPNLTRLDVIPMVFPHYPDTRLNLVTGEEYDVPRSVWLREQVNVADYLPCLAERKWGDVVWRAFTWSSYTRLKPDVEPLVDEYGCTAEDYDPDNPEDEYY